MPAEAAGKRDKPNKKDLQAEAMQGRICDAVVVSLDRYGYSDTSINRIQEIAGVSRGALTHHFATKQDLVAETAMRLLDRAMEASRKRRMPAMPSDGSADPVETYLVRTWKKVVNTPQGRALVEILVAMRTDPELQALLADRLAAWDAEISRAIAEVFAPVSGDEADLATVWTICRTFLRGLFIQSRFTADPDALPAIMKRFAGIIAPHLKLREDQP